MMQKTIFKDLFIYKNKSFVDKRGHFKELLKEKELKIRFPFTVMSFSKKNIIRGLHIQTKNPQVKYISVIKGKIFDVAVDLRKNSKTFGKFYTCYLSEKNSKSIYVPPGFAHGFCTIDKENYVVYSCTKYRNAKSEVAIKYDDKKINIKWPKKNLTVSKKDQNGITFSEYKMKYLK